MSDVNTLESRYKGHWDNVERDCMLCEMEKRTEWYLETKNWVVAEKLGGGPFVVYKSHQKELSDEEWQDMERVVGKVFDKFDISVKMSLVRDHWHGHLLVEDENIDLSDE